LQNGVLEVKAPEKCIFCEECKKVEDDIKETNLIKIGKPSPNVGRKKDKFNFTVESSGVLPPSTIVKKSIQILGNKLKALESKII
jgi:DNA-directed RNA polymerase II subunit RPB3